MNAVNIIKNILKIFLKIIGITAALGIATTFPERSRIASISNSLSRASRISSILFFFFINPPNVTCVYIILLTPELLPLNLYLQYIFVHVVLYKSVALSESLHQNMSFF